MGSVVYNPIKNEKKQTTDTTILNCPNMEDSLAEMGSKCSDQNGAGKIDYFTKSSTMSTPTGSTGATSLTHIRDAYMYTETNSNNSGTNVYCIFEKKQMLFKIKRLVSILTDT